MNALRLSRTVARCNSKMVVRTLAHDAPKSGGPMHKHKHPMWDLPFNKGTVYGIIWGGSALGVAVISLSVSLAQWKAGIWFKSEPEA